MVVAKTLTAALGRRRGHGGHSPNCAACARRRLQEQQQLGTREHQPKRKLRDHQQKFSLFFPFPNFLVATETLAGKSYASQVFATKCLRISTAVVRLALWVSGS